MALEPGSTLAHYRILSRLGAGGMGEVFLAEDTRLLRKVAIKVLVASVADNPDYLSRFLQEARAASALNHPNVAHIYELGERSDANGVLHYLAMEYVEGQTLEEKLTSDPMPLAEILGVGAQVADALDAAHARGIVHRDIKPANLMVDSRKNVKVLDFGLAKFVPEPSSGQSNSKNVTQFLTSGGGLLGTVSYMSPEQAMGKDIDTRTDLFSLGVVLYRMATGRLPFNGLTTQETLARILQSQPDALARLNYELPEAFENIVRKCLEKDRDRRYQSAKELLVDLRNLERGPDPVERGADSGRSTAGLSRIPRTLRAVIVDDEELARRLMREYLSRSGGVEIVAECGNGFEAVKAIGELKPDLVFLDVQMPKLDGFEVLQLIDPSVPVIFVTAFDQYAMRAFDAHAVDYLLKPFSEERLHKALERARDRLGEARLKAGPAPTAIANMDLAIAARPPEQKLERIVVKDGTKVHIIPIEKLDYVEAQDDYIALHSEKKNYLKQQTISSIETQLDPKKFVRIHRSYIANLEKIARIEPYTKDSRIAVLTDGAQLPVSRAGHAKLKTLLGEVG